MNDTPPQDPSVRDILSKFEQTADGWLLHDTVARRHRLARMMAEHDDPVMREMGEQLRDGHATPRRLASVPEYWETLQRGVSRLAETDLAELDGRLEDTLERERGEPDRKRGEG
jgi:hypothetical protein